MTKEPSKLLALAGIALIAGFFLPWIDAGPFGSASGLDVFQRTDWSFFKLVVLAVPVGGVALLAAAMTGQRAARAAGLTIGVGVLGYGTFKIVQTFFEVSGLGLWLVIGAGLVSLFAALFTRR